MMSQIFPTGGCVDCLTETTASHAAIEMNVNIGKSKANILK